MKILLINCHPDYTNTKSASNILLARAIELLKRLQISKFELLELYNKANPIPQIGAKGFKEEDKPIHRNLLNQFKEADIVLFFTPLHNYNVTSKTKDYIDNLLIVNETFKYTHEGLKGLLDPHKIVALIVASGSDFTHYFEYHNLDIAPRYMRAILSVMGIDYMKLIRAEGMDIIGNDRQAIIENASNELHFFIQDTIEKIQLYKESI